MELVEMWKQRARHILFGRNAQDKAEPAHTNVAFRGGRERRTSTPRPPKKRPPSTDATDRSNVDLLSGTAQLAQAMNEHNAHHLFTPLEVIDLFMELGNPSMAESWLKSFKRDYSSPEELAAQRGEKVANLAALLHDRLDQPVTTRR